MKNEIKEGDSVKWIHRHNGKVYSKSGVVIALVMPDVATGKVYDDFIPVHYRNLIVNYSAVKRYKIGNIIPRNFCFVIDENNFLRTPNIVSLTKIEVEL
jgi:hypothetical protein